MSTYLVPAWVPSQAAKVGWDRDMGTFWFVVFERGPFGVTEGISDPSAIKLTGGLDDDPPILSVAMLVSQSWGEIEWDSPEGLAAAHNLRDDPSLEDLANPETYKQRGVEEFVVRALGSKRDGASSGIEAAPTDGRRGLLRSLRR